MTKIEKIEVQLKGIGKQMLKKTVLACSAAMLSMAALANNTVVEMKTTAGNIEIELFNTQAPVSTKNFEHYVKTKFYNGTIFHRVIPGFMIQAGGFNSDLIEKTTTRPAIRNEADHGLSNKRGTLAMARTQDPNSAKSQFFINVADNTDLDQQPGQAGYAVFGQVTKGMDVVDKIVNTPTYRVGIHNDMPRNSIKILSMSIKPTAKKTQHNIEKK